MSIGSANFYQKKLALQQAVLAPMAGYTDAPFRHLCRSFGSAWAVTEMVSAKGLVKGNLQGITIGEPYPNEPDLVIQIFGGEPTIVAQGARILYEKYQPQAIDLNMGCPVKKITSKHCGSKLMLEPALAADIVTELVQAIPIPISVKMRLGYDEINVLEVAQAIEASGASMVAIHGRTAKQKYSGEADWQAIKNVADNLMIPVVGSGDVHSKEQFDRYQSWGLGVMLARHTVGKPWLFAELKGAPSPNAHDIARIAYKHALLHVNWYASKTEEQAMRSLRSQLLKYFAFLPDARGVLSQISSLLDLRTFIFSRLQLELSNMHAEELKRPPAQAA